MAAPELVSGALPRGPARLLRGLVFTGQKFPAGGDCGRSRIPFLRLVRAPGNPSAGSSPRGSPQVLAPSVLAVTSAVHYGALRPVYCLRVSSPGTLPALWRLGGIEPPTSCLQSRCSTN